MYVRLPNLSVAVGVVGTGSCMLDCLFYQWQLVWLAGVTVCKITQSVSDNGSGWHGWLYVRMPILSMTMSLVGRGGVC